MMRCRFVSMLVLITLVTSLATARQPQSAPSVIPAINPAQARADGVLGGLDGPGIGIAYHNSSGMLTAVSESGSRFSWGPDALLGIRGSVTAAPHNSPAQETSVIALAASGEYLATSGTDSKVIVWNQKTSQPVKTLEAGTLVRAMAFLDAGKSLVTVGESGAVQFWESATGKAGLKWQASDDWLLAVAISPDGKTIATGGLDGKLRIWETKDGKKGFEAIIQPAAQPNQPASSAAPIASLLFAPDGKSILAGSQDGSIYQVGIDGKLIRILAGHGSTVTSLIIHPAGQVLISGSKDRTLRLWNVTNGQAIKTLEGHTSWVLGITLIAQGTRVASVSADHSVRIWDLSEPAKK